VSYLKEVESHVLVHCKHSFMKQASSEMTCYILVVQVGRDIWFGNVASHSRAKLHIHKYISPPLIKRNYRRLLHCWPRRNARPRPWSWAVVPFEDYQPRVGRARNWSQSQPHGFVVRGGYFCKRAARPCASKARQHARHGPYWLTCWELPNPL
jgi:hypothetical protein